MPVYPGALPGTNWAPHQLGSTNWAPTGQRGESFNMANHPVFGSPNTTVDNAQFGRVTGTANSPRQTQFALKFLF